MVFRALRIAHCRDGGQMDDAPGAGGRGRRVCDDWGRRTLMSATIAAALARPHKLRRGQLCCAAA